MSVYAVPPPVPVNGGASDKEAVGDTAARQVITKVLSQLGVTGDQAALVKTDGCAKPKSQDWARLVFLNETVKHEVLYGKNCDVQGTLNLSRKGFPVDLAIRNLPGANRIKAFMKPDVKPDLVQRNVTITFNATDGALLIKAPAGKEGGELAGFDANYQVVTSLDGKLKENRGGTLQLESFRGKEVKTDIPLQIPIT